MSGHTPGPWHVSGTPRDGSGEAALHVGAATSPMVLASMNPVHVDTEANARLIAAAPDAFHALKLALEYWEHRQQRYRNRHPVWVQEARAAIAKATGAA